MGERAVFHVHTLYKYNVYKYMKLSFKFNLRSMGNVIKIENSWKNLWITIISSWFQLASALPTVSFRWGTMNLMQFPRIFSKLNLFIEERSVFHDTHRYMSVCWLIAVKTSLLFIIINHYRFASYIGNTRRWVYVS